MKGGNRITATNHPFNAPIAVPAVNPIKTDSSTGIPYLKVNWPIKTEVITAIAPTDKSIPAVRMTILCAAATIPTIWTC